MNTWWLTGVKKWDPNTDLSILTLPNKSQTSCTNLLSNTGPLTDSKTSVRFTGSKPARVTCNFT